MIETAYAFAYAMRDQDEIIYEIVDPSKWHRIDEWIASHKINPCIEEVDEINVGVTINHEFTDLTISCYLENGSIYFFRIKGIQIAEHSDGKFFVTDWEEIID